MPSPRKESSGNGTAAAKTWSIAEDGEGILRPQQSGAGDILRILTRDGSLLAECGPAPLLPEHGLHGGPGKRLLRYYISNADRRVVLEDGRGSSWLARITGTRWRGNQRIWSFRGQRQAPSSGPGITPEVTHARAIQPKARRA